MSWSRDWEFIQKAAVEMQEFLLSDLPSWPVGGRDGSIQRLTIGQWLLSTRCLTYYIAFPDQYHTAFLSLANQVSMLKEQWRAAWSRKIFREAVERENLWSTYLAEWLEQGETGIYSHEVRQRVILALLQDEEQKSFIGKLTGNLEMRIKQKMRQGRFIWEVDLISAFPRENFWFLYIEN